MKRRTLAFVAATLAVVVGMLAGPVRALDVAKTVDGCASCHGKDGSTAEPDVPTIAGQSVEYLVANLAAYRDQQRPCPESKYRSGPHKGDKVDMCQVLKGMSDGDLRQLAQSYAGKTFVRFPQTFDAELARKGKEVHDKNCEKCHSDGGSQSADDSGVLAGQRMQYLTQSMDEFRSGKRKPPQKMKPRIDKLDDAAVQALVHYYGSFK
jgi:cytochrome subunit of sulfide dehydrogenase